MKRIYILVLTGLFVLSLFSQKTVISPDKLYGQLFIDVQLLPVFPDSKTFVDCIPKRSPEEIMDSYRLLKRDSV
jgi:alpha,alpha-trehalase